MFSTLPNFYCSKEWRSFRASLLGERMKRDGAIISDYSGKELINNYDIVLHHVQPLTMQNVNDYSISLNAANIMVVSQTEHNEIHGRFGYCTERKVYYVYGPACAGKTTFVNKIKGNSDLIIDMDNIWQCITGGQRYNKPNALKTNAFAVRDLLLEQVKTRAGKWERVFYITGGAVKGIREREIQALGAEPIFIDTDKETCLKRLQNDNERSKEHKEEWKQYILKWFEDYTE